MQGSLKANSRREHRLPNLAGDLDNRYFEICCQAHIILVSLLGIV